MTWEQQAPDPAQWNRPADADPDWQKVRPRLGFTEWDAGATTWDNPAPITYWDLGLVPLNLWTKQNVEY
jgi:hypothetical protein